LTRRREFATDFGCFTVNANRGASVIWFPIQRIAVMSKFISSCAFVLMMAASAALLLNGCGGGGGTTSQTGRISLHITDAPVDAATAVVVKFTAIELKPESGDAFTITLDPAQSLDLLALAGGSSRELLAERAVPAGRYTWVRLLIDAGQNAQSSYIDLEDGQRFSLFVPSGSESGLKLIRGFTVAAGSVSNFTIDFDLRKSVIAPPGQSPNYLLKPVLRMVDNLEVGTLTGTVASALIPTGCTPQVYVFSGANVVPDDLDAAAAPDVDPLVSAPVTLDAASGEYRFRIGFIEAGDYTASFTCDGALDTPEGEETLVFAGTRNVTINANGSTAIAFSP
jgi:hypothetical protein